jgi:hypothetical protein
MKTQQKFKKYSKQDDYKIDIIQKSEDLEQRFPTCGSRPKSGSRDPKVGRGNLPGG